MRSKFKECHKCEERFLGCHSVCKRHLAEVEQNRQEKEQIYAAKSKNREYYSYKKSIEKRFR